MKHKSIFTLLLIVSIFLSINVISAADVDLNQSNDLLNTESIALEDAAVPDINSEVSISDESQILDSDSNGDTIEIWVNKNVSSSGDGSKENPFSNLQDAHDKIIDSSSKNAVINIEDGEYEIPYKDSPPFIPEPDFYFYDVNLIINGLGNNVILSADGAAKTFQINTGSNLTINNVIFKVSSRDWDVVYGVPGDEDVGYASLPLVNCSINVINCTFTFNSNYNGLVRNEYDINYIGCIFINSGNRLFTSSKGSPGSCYFENCIFINPHFSNETYFANDAIFNGIWLSSNTIPTYSVYMVVPTYHWETMDVFTTTAGTGDSGLNYVTCLEKYAIFSVSENYLGDNQYEIVGKLTWNGTDSSEGMENFPPMPVSLKSTTGVIQNATLINGIFKVNYTSSASEHKVTVKLDSEEKNLTFSNINFNLNPQTISFGNNQITITFPEYVNGTIFIDINDSNHPYEINDSNSITIPIADELSIGNHEVSVTFIDKTNHIYGFNTTILTISKVKDYTFNISEITDVKIGDTKEITITLPNDANGQIVILMGNNTFTEIVNGNITKVNITGFVLGENIINITYSGNNEKYEPNTKIINVSAVKETTLTTTNVTTTYNLAKELIITLTSNGEVLNNKSINVVVGNINKNLTTNASGQVSIDVSTLAPNTYVVNIAFAGDDLYLKSSTTANVVINKIDSSIKATTVTTTYNVAKNLVVTLTANGKALVNQKVTVKVGTISKTLTTNAKGQVSVDVSKLTPKTYTATFTYAGDDINTKSSNTAKVVINKVKPKITAKKATFKAKKKTKKYNIVLKDNKGKAIKKAKVTLKVKGKTYKATTNSKGKATFKITKLTKKGKNIATIKFGGNNYFKSISKKVNIVVKK